MESGAGAGVRSQESGAGVRSQESIFSLRRKLQAPIGTRYELENLFVAGLKFVTSLKTPRSQKIMARSTIPIFNSVTPATPELLQLLFKGCVGAFFSY